MGGKGAHAFLALASVALAAMPIPVHGSKPRGSIQISTDTGKTWPYALPTGGGVEKLRREQSVNDRYPIRVRTDSSVAGSEESRDLDSAVVSMRLPPLCDVEVVRWFDAAGDGHSVKPFALGWRRARVGSGCLESEKVTLRAKAADIRQPNFVPRWQSYRYEVTEKSEKERAARESADETQNSILVRYQRYLLPCAIIAIIALGHGIYLGVTAVEEDENDLKRRREVEQARIAQLHNIAGIKVVPPKPRKRKTKQAAEPSSK